MTQEYKRLEEMTLRQLRRVASKYKIFRYSRMRKAELLAVIEAYERNNGINQPEETKGDLQTESIRENQAPETTTKDAPITPPLPHGLPTSTAADAETPMPIAAADQPYSFPGSDIIPGMEMGFVPLNVADSSASQQTQNLRIVPPTSNHNQELQEDVEAKKFEVGSATDTSESDALASVDEGLGELPDGYGEPTIVFLPRDPQWGYVYWDVTDEHKQRLRDQGGRNLALQLCDVTDGIPENYAYQNVQEFSCDELTRDWYVPIPVSDRVYLVELGYRCKDGSWLTLVRSRPMKVPPIYPSSWSEEILATISPGEDLVGKTVYKFNRAISNFAQMEIDPSLPQPISSVPGSVSPSSISFAAIPGSVPSLSSVELQQVSGSIQGSSSIELQRISGSIQGSSSIELQRVSGSIQGSSSIELQRVVGSMPTSISHLSSSSHAFTQGFSGMLASGSGIGWSGASMAPPNPHKFWLIADAELIVYGMTEPDATLTIGDREVELKPDGTFRFQMSFQDGLIDYPIKAVAKDGQQTRSVHLQFSRITTDQNTNTKEEAVEEWF